MTIHKNHHSIPKKKGTLLKTTGSVMFAIIASSHHWLHTLLIALGLTTIGTGLLVFPPTIKLVLLLLSLVLSIWFIRVAKHKWTRERPAAWVYLISSVISIILVITAIPNTITDLNQPNQQQEQEQHNQHDDHS
ncbi:MAG: hypothetical protein R3267_02230 [Paenisporosarcina sp.]|nr:hypothetical protein [Paenisporosarcina sp.]